MADRESHKDGSSLGVFCKRISDSGIWGFSAIERKCQRHMARRREGVDDDTAAIWGFPGLQQFQGFCQRERERDGWTDGKRALPLLLLPERKPDLTDHWNPQLEGKTEVAFWSVVWRCLHA